MIYFYLKEFFELLVGILELGKLIVFWDDNGIFIDGKVDGWFCDDMLV